MTNTSYDTLQQQLATASNLYRDLLRECAEVLREDTEACRGFHLRHKTCKICAPLRDLLKRVEAAI